MSAKTQATQPLTRSSRYIPCRIRTCDQNGRTALMQVAPIQIVWLFGIVGGFVLLLACINFMNPEHSPFLKKGAKEVGIRKAVGSARSQLMFQFFSESFLVVGLAFAVALLVVTRCLR